MPPEPAHAAPSIAEIDHAAREAALAAALLDAQRPPPDGLLAPGGGPIARRFAVHRATATLSSIAALATRFPVLERLLGPETFADLARAFLRVDRPRTALLLDWGDHLPDFVAARPDLADWPWLADVARLECAWSDAHHAADAEPLALSELARIAPEMLAESRFVLHPSLRRLASSHPVAAIWAAEGDLGAIAPEPQKVLILRPRADVVVRVVDPAGWRFVAALEAGAGLADAAGDARAVDPSFEPGPRLVGLVRLGVIVAIAPGEPKEPHR